MRRLVPALCGLALVGSCAPRQVADTLAPGVTPAEVALGPAAGPGPEAADVTLPSDLVRGMWERRVTGGRVRVSFDNQTIRIAVVEDRGGREVFYVQGRWSPGGPNVLLCEGTAASLVADARAIPELDGAGVFRTRLKLHPPGAISGNDFDLDFTGVSPFSFRMRPAGDGVVIDRFEAENFSDRAKRLCEGRYVRQLP
jgi:hypothetical protein